MNGFRVRTHRPDDAGQLVALLRRSVLELGPRRYRPDQVRAWAESAPSEERLRRKLADGRGCFVAVDETDTPVAFADLEGDGHIDYFYCDPRAAGTGVAGALFACIEASARALGLARLHAEVSETARGFFERRGFTTVERRELDLCGVAIHNYRAEKVLAEGPEPSGDAAVRADLHEANRLSWNAATRAHNRHKSGQAHFLRSGGSTLFPEERALLGDLDGRRVLHLLCNSGQDSLSIAALGAEVVGVDISDEAIEAARNLSHATGIGARFERADVYDWLPDRARRGHRWDVVFLSYGALCWLSDLPELFRLVARVLSDEGRLIVMEFHPLARALDDDLRPRWPYFSAGAEPDEGVGDYVAASGPGLLPWGGEPAATGFRNPHGDYCFGWSLAETVQATIDAGLRVSHLREYPYSNGCRLLAPLEMDDQRRWHLPANAPLPLMFSLVAVRS